MTERRTRGDGSLYWHDKRQRWIATVTVGYDGRGKRIVRSASGRSRTEAKSKLRELKRDEADGISAANSAITVRQAVEDWLTYGISRRSSTTVKKYRVMAAKHIFRPLGARKLRDLSATEVDRWLSRLAPTLSTRTLQELRSILSRSVNRAMARDLVRRNVVDLAEVPQGRAGRRSKSLNAEQVDAVLTQTAPDRLHHYIVVSLLTGARTEELRALRWQHVHLDGNSDARPPIPPHIEVWRSVRHGGDTKTRKSRRTLALPARCIEALRKQRAQQAADRLAADDWKDTGLVFTTVVGTAMDAANVRRDLRRALALVPGIDPGEWTPRELRHSFVSVLSDAGIPVEQIAQLVGHSGTTVTELVYRHQLRPVIQTGATVMDHLFSPGSGSA
jgi:integrase